MVPFWEISAKCSSTRCAILQDQFMFSAGFRERCRQKTLAGKHRVKGRNKLTRHIRFQDICGGAGGKRRAHVLDIAVKCKEHEWRNTSAIFELAGDIQTAKRGHGNLQYHNLRS